MGGYGSGAHNSLRARRTVEDCLTLNIGSMLRDGSIKAGRRSAGVLTWRRRGEKIATIGYEFWDTEEDSCLLLKYKSNGTTVELPVPITSRPAHFGGVRLYLLCPLCSDEKRLSKLYLPPRERYFACRRCHDLTYLSSQESRKYDRLYRLLAGDTGYTPEEVKKSLRRFG